MGWLKDFVRNPIKRLSKDISNTFNFIGDMISGTIGFIGDLFSMNFMPDMPNVNTNDINNGTTVNRAGGNQSIPLIYTVAKQSGFYESIKLGGIKVHTSSDGTNNKYLYITYVLGHGPFTYVRFEDEEFRKTVDIIPGIITQTQAHAIEYFASDGVTKEGEMYQYTQGFGPYAKVFIHSGNTSDMTTTPSWHADTKTYPGLCHIKVRLEMPEPSANLDPVPFTGLPSFTFYVQRESPTLLGSGTYSSHADMLYDYLINKVYGAGLETSDLDLASFKTYHPTNLNSQAEGVNGSLTQMFWRVPPGQSHSDNIKAMLFEMGSTLVWRNGVWVLKENPNILVTKKHNSKFPALVGHTIAEQDIVGGVSLENTPVDQRYSEVKGKYFSKQNDVGTGPGGGGWLGILFQYQDWADLSVIIPENNILEIGTMGPTWSLLTNTWLESNNSAVISFTTNSKHLSVEAYDMVYVTYANANLNSGEFIVTNVTINPNLTVTIQAKQLYRNTALDQANFYLPNIGNTNSDAVDKKDLVKIPTGFGLTGNTQVDQFTNAPNKLPSLGAITVDVDPGLSILRDDGSYNLIVGVKFAELSEPDINTYIIELREQGQPSFNIVDQTEANSLFLNNLKPNMPYIMQITPRTQQGRRGISVTQTFTTGNIGNQGQSITFADNILTSEEFPQGIANATTFDDAYYVWGHADYNYDTTTGTGGDHPGLDDNFVKGVYSEAQWDEFVGSWGAHDYSGATPPTGNFYPPVNRWWGNPSWIGFAAALNVESRTTGDFDTGNVDEYWWTARVKAFPSNDSVEWFNDSSATYEIANKQITAIESKDTSGASYTADYAESGSSSAQLAEPVNGRFFKTTYAGIATNIGTEVVPVQLELTFRNDVWTRTFKDIDTSTLSGDADNRVFTWTMPRFMKIKTVLIESAATETEDTVGFLTAEPVVNTNSITFTVTRMTSGQHIDATVDITVIGYPEVKQEDLGSDYGFGDYVINWQNKQ